MTWPLLGRGSLANARNYFPGVTIPEESLDVYRERIHCRPDGTLSYPVERRIVAPDGTLVAKRAYDADVEREKAEKPPNGWSPTRRYSVASSSNSPRPLCYLSPASDDKAVGEPDQPPRLISSACVKGFG
jgi:hypothetical protein